MPKISVIMLLYNRKHYVADAIDSVLNQTFQDFEFIIRDDGSTDGSYDFVAEKYSKQISSGKIKLRRNEKNLGEFPTFNNLLLEAEGKYFSILHSDDLYTPHALQHWFEVAEKYSADVVHCSFLLNSPPDGIIQQDTKLQLTCWETRPAKQIEIIPNDPFVRFKEWGERGTFIDLPYNIYNRKSFLQECFCEGVAVDKFNELAILHLYWLMKLKVFVKTPEVCYIRRDSPDSLTNSHKVADLIKTEINRHMTYCQNFERIFSNIDFFTEHPEYIRFAKMKLLNNHAFQIVRRGIYKNGITPELDKVVRESFEKFLGQNAEYPALLFHLVNIMQINENVEQYVLQNYLNPPPPQP